MLLCVSRSNRFKSCADLCHLVSVLPAACPGLPSTPVSNLASWNPACFSADVDTTCYGTCRTNFTGDDAPRSKCVSNGTATYWSTPVPQACMAGTTQAPRAFIVDQQSAEVSCFAGQQQVNVLGY